MSLPSNSLALFDIDGTLMRGAGRAHKDALIDGVRQVTGRNTTLEGIDTAGKLDCDLIAAMLRAAGETEEQINHAMRDIMQACQRCYVANSIADLSHFLCPGVRDKLETLTAQGTVLGLVTGNLSAIGWKKVALAGIRNHFSVGAFAEDASTRAGLARLAADRALSAGLIAGHARISLIGDHANDVAAARANGFLSVAVATGPMPYEDLEALHPDILLRYLEELDIERLL